MDLVDEDSFHGAVDFVFAEPRYNTNRFGNQPNADHDVFSVQKMLDLFY